MAVFSEGGKNLSVSPYEAFSGGGDGCLFSPVYEEDFSYFVYIRYHLVHETTDMFSFLCIQSWPNESTCHQSRWDGGTSYSSLALRPLVKP